MKRILSALVLGAFFCGALPAAAQTEAESREKIRAEKRKIKAEKRKIKAEKRKAREERRKKEGAS
jgi:Ni/Co efflux regulator RcnB